MTDVSAAGGRTPSRALEQALVDAAERVLVRDGLGGVTVRAVAAEAGVAPMGVYNRFGSKDGLVAAVLARGFEGLRAATGAADDADPVDRLLTCGRNYRDFALSHPQHYARDVRCRLRRRRTDRGAGRPRGAAFQVAGRPGRLRDGPGCAAAPVTRSRPPS